MWWSESWGGSASHLPLRPRTLLKNTGEEGESAAATPALKRHQQDDTHTRGISIVLRGWIFHALGGGSHSRPWSLYSAASGETAIPPPS